MPLRWLTLKWLTWCHVAIWKICISTFTILIATKLTRVLNSGRNFGTQLLKSSDFLFMEVVLNLKIMAFILIFHAPSKLVKIPKFEIIYLKKKYQERGRVERRERHFKWIKIFSESRYMKFSSQFKPFIRFWCMHRPILFQTRLLEILNVLLN